MEQNSVTAFENVVAVLQTWLCPKEKKHPTSKRARKQHGTSMECFLLSLEMASNGLVFIPLQESSKLKYLKINGDRITVSFQASI